MLLFTMAVTARTAGKAARRTPIAVKKLVEGATEGRVTFFELGELPRAKQRLPHPDGCCRIHQYRRARSGPLVLLRQAPVRPRLDFPHSAAFARRCPARLRRGHRVV